MKFLYKGQSFVVKGISYSDHIYKIITQNQVFYEIDLLEYIEDITKDINKTLCIDIGANIGNHSIFLGKFVGSHVISVEPNPLILPILNENLQNNIDNYTLFDCALGEKPGSGKVVMPDNSSANIGMAKIEIGVPNNGQQQNALVYVRTLDSIYEEWLGDGNNGEVLLIKIDVEGMELDVLKGATTILTKFRPHLFVEAITKDELKKLENFLSKFGYTWLTHWAYTPVYHFVYKPSFKIRLKAYFYKIKHQTKLLYWKLMNKVNKMR